MIRIQNIYHMLAYAFQTLQGQGYRDIAAEEFDNTADLLAEILSRGVSLQLKRGLGREYVDRKDMLSSPRGKIELSESLKMRSILRRQLVCSYDEFSTDTRMNRILKATIMLLIRSDIDKARKKALRRLLPYFVDVEDVNLSDEDWHMRFDRNNQTYRMLMNVCWLVVKGLLQTRESGSLRMMDFLDEQRMSHLYEKFILEYYRREHPELSAGAPYISWALDDGFGDMLPAMHTDITLTRGRTVLIIDAKYYSHTTQQQFDKQSVHSGNLYQIFTYVKNKEAELASTHEQHSVSGMLLYAKTDEDVQPDGMYQMSGNQISVRTLDLNQPFETIRSQLDGIAEAHFSKEAPMFESLTKHLPAIENAEGFGNWVVDRESKGTMDDPITMPYVNYGTTVADVEQAIYDFVDRHPEYELTHYRDILERNGLEWGSQAMSGADVSELGGQAVMALLLGAVRAERFCDGALLGFFEDGSMRRWLLRLKGIDGRDGNEVRHE